MAMMGESAGQVFSLGNPLLGYFTYPHSAFSHQSTHFLVSRNGVPCSQDCPAESMPSRRSLSPVGLQQCPPYCSQRSVSEASRYEKAHLTTFEVRPSIDSILRKGCCYEKTSLHHCRLARPPSTLHRSHWNLNVLTREYANLRWVQ